MLTPDFIKEKGRCKQSRLVCLFLSLLCLVNSMLAQKLADFTDRLAAFGKTIPQEKVYVHMDNTCYFLGDTIWFSAYTRQTNTGRPSQVSGVLYVELLNNDGFLVERKLIEMREGHGNGFFALNNQIQYSGFYELRAYTRWQLNWGEYEHKHCRDMKDYFYNEDLERAFYRDYEKLYSRVFPVYDRPLTPGDYTQDMTLRVLRRTFKNDPDVPTPTLTLFPEGGNLVAGVPCRVAFEAVMSNGEWLEGWLHVGSDSVPTVNRGRGVFTMTPEKGMEREVFFTTKEGESVKAKLPKAEEQGVAISVTENGKELRIKATASDSGMAQRLGMTIMHEGLVEEFLVFPDSTLTFSFVPANYCSGVHQVTVFDVDGRVWADRLFFSRGKESFQPTLTVKVDKEQYGPEQPIVIDVESQAREATVSLAVRDVAHQDNLYDNANILTEMLLSSEIRGFVPNPGWYFEKDDEEHRQALDLLLMAQGWRRFDWRDMAVHGAWELTQPNEYTPIIEGQIRYNMRYTIDFSPVYDTYDKFSEWHNGILEEAKSFDESVKQTETQETSKQEDWNDVAMRRREENEQKYNLKRKTKAQTLRVHAECVPVNSLEPLTSEMDTKDHRFRIILPRYYGKSVFFLSVADTTKWKDRKTPYTWIQMAGSPTELALHHQRKLDTEDAKYMAYVSWPYPRFVKPYNYYRTHPKDIEWEDESLPAVQSDSIHQMKEIAVKARRRSRLKRFNDAFPALSMDAYEAWNFVEDAGMPLYLFPDLPELARALFSDYGQATIYDGNHSERVETQFGISPTRRALPQYIDIPVDSLYHPKYLRSIGKGFDWSPGEKKDYYGDTERGEDPRFRIDRYVVYTDYQPRLEGSKRYAGANLPETRVAIYPYYDGSQRLIYRDRRYILDGFAYPADFYSPDYSRQRLPEGQKDYRRTLYWNPNLQLDENGQAHVTFYNNSRTTQISVEAEGQASDGTLLWSK